MSHSHDSKHTVIIQWNSVTIRDHQPLCLTGQHVSQSLWLQAHSEYPVLPSEITKHVSQSLWLKHTVNIQWKGVTIKNHSEITCICLANFMYTVNVYCLVHTVLHTHTHRVSTEMVLPSTVTDHSPSLSTVHFHTQWMVLEMEWHYQSPSSHHQPSTNNHAGSEHLRSVTRQNRINYHTRLANIPFLCTVNTMLVPLSLVHGKSTHPMVSSRMPCTPLRVCAPSPASQSGLAPSSMLSATVLVHRKPTRTHTHPVVSSRMPCTPAHHPPLG